MEKIISLLVQLNFSNEEIKCYSTILEKCPVSVGDIAKHMGLHRVTVHHTLKKLLKKKIITTKKKNRNTFVSISNPEILKNLLNDEIKKTENLKSNFTKIADSMRRIVNEKILENDTDVSFCKGEIGIKEIYKEIHTYIGEIYSMELLDDDFFYNFLEYRIGFMYHDNDNDYIKGDLFKKRLSKEIALDTPESRIIRKDVSDCYQCRFMKMDNENDFGFEFYMYNDKVIMITHKKGNDDSTCCTVIKSPIICNNLIMFHKIIWSLLPKNDKSREISSTKDLLENTKQDFSVSYDMKKNKK